MTSMSWFGMLGTRAVLMAVATVAVAQLAFTYMPFMQHLFATRPVLPLEGLVILGVGVAVMPILEVEKAILRRFGLFDGKVG